MKKILYVLVLALLTGSIAIADSKPFTLDFTRIFSKQKKSTATIEMNLYEEGCDAADFIVPAGTTVSAKALEGASCAVSASRKLPGGAREVRVRMKMELDSQENCGFFVTNRALKKHTAVIFSCIGT